ncbi:MAG: RtcB family protein [Desulfopila sp.]|jgi:tRNA-splicing ligase RtcB|nr:RtcB family protein [Desulfopila sp.]
MKTTLTTEKIPITLWLDDIEDSALQQARNLANLPFAFHHVAVMADAHFGYGMPIGGVLATEDVIIPNAVGVDIGCGVCAVQSSLDTVDGATLKNILAVIRQEIPTGFKRHRHKQSVSDMPKLTEEQDILKIVSSQFENARTQLGTLGGGNHFIEIQQGSDNRIWVMVHSGSRNLGYQVAGYYNKLAAQLNRKWKSPVDPKWQLAYLPLTSEAGRAYFAEMRYCVDFALHNRLIMMEKIEEIVHSFFPGVVFASPINIAHNYAATESHFGKDVVIHRKGATRALKDEQGIVPGSQGTKSFIVRGKGNRESFSSCSHGAGRKLGRKEAQRKLHLDEEIALLERQNILHGIRSKKDLDEAAGAYKNIDTVMANQSDLVDIDIILQPLAVIKG